MIEFGEIVLNAKVRLPTHFSEPVTVESKVRRYASRKCGKWID